MHSKKKTILFFTGTRADFGKIVPLARAAFREGYTVEFFVTGMHMIRKFGLTKMEVHKERYAEVVELINQRPGDTQDIILAKTIAGFSDFIIEKRPDLVVIHGDRIEALAASIVCATNNLRSAHVEGGEISGTIDEALRHATTKLCTHHFVSSNRAAMRVRKMGESHDHIYNIGSPELDVHAQNKDLTLVAVKKYYQIDFDDYGICLFHPVTTELKTMKGQAEVLFDALAKSKRDFIVISPNNDPGAEFIDDCISRLPSSQFRCIPSMRFLYFSTLLKNAACIIGNSSAGVREAPFFGIASINIGNRQSNRSSAESIHNLNSIEIEKILSALEIAWNKRYPKCCEFGEGEASKKFMQVIGQDSFWASPLQKSYFENEGVGSGQEFIKV